MDQEPTITIKNEPAPADIDLLRSRVIEFNRSHVPETSGTTLLLTVDGDAGQMTAGLYAQIYYSWMFVELLWVAEEARSHGYGSRLLVQAEEQARRHGCHFVWLDTFSFQAPEFYKKHGYEVFGELPHYPAEHRRYFLYKKLG